jgi:hypothetical protein
MVMPSGWYAGLVWQCQALACKKKETVQACSTLYKCGTYKALLAASVDRLQQAVQGCCSVEATVEDVH